MKFSLPTSNKGFTLVELLVVIAVLGVLAAGVLVAINPVEQLARGRDTSRRTAITEAGRGASAYYTTQGAVVNGTGGFLTNLKAAGEIKVIPDNPGTGADCTAFSGAETAGATANMESGYCFESNTTTNEFVIYSPIESSSEKLKATGNGTTTCTSGSPYFVYSSAAGKTGVVCSTDVDPGITTLN